MKNIPLFTTSAGVASVILEQIPFNKAAYIRVQSALEPEMLLQECLSFCKAIGAEAVYATGVCAPNEYISKASIIHMQRKREGLSSTEARAVVINAQNAEEFRSIHNEKMSGVQNASYLTKEYLQELISKSCGYFVYHHEELIGLGIADGDRIHSVISLKRGEGEHVFLALCGALAGESVNVEVIDNNIPAIRLYQRLGFLYTETISDWYKIF